MLTKHKAHRQAVKISDNNVELQYYLFNKDQEQVILEEYTQSFGKTRILSIREQAQNTLAYWQQFDPELVVNELAVASKSLSDIETIFMLKDQADGTITDLG